MTDFSTKRDLIAFVSDLLGSEGSDEIACSIIDSQRWTWESTLKQTISETDLCYVAQKLGY